MDKKQTYLKVVGGLCCTRDEYLEAFQYYLDSSKEEKILFDSFEQQMGKKLLNLLIKKDHVKYNLFLNRHGLVFEDGISFMESYIHCFNVKDKEQLLAYLNAKYGDIELFLRELYGKVKNILWNTKELEYIAHSYFLHLELLIYLIKLYLSCYSNLSSKEIEEKEIQLYSDKAFLNFLNRSLTNSKEYKQAIWYLNNKASKEEQEDYYRAYFKIGKEVDQRKKDTNEDLNVYHFIAKKYYLPISFIKQSHHDFIMMEEPHSFLINQDIKRAIEDEHDEYYQACLLFLTDTPCSQLESFIVLQKIDMSYLSRHYVSKFISLYCSKMGCDFQDVEEKLLSNLKKYITFQRNRRRVYKHQMKRSAYSEEEILEAKYIVTKLIHLEKGINDYTRSLGMEKYYQVVNIIKLVDPKLYDLYYARTNRGKFFIQEHISLLVDYLKNGINYQNGLRPFDILDYYQIFGVPIHLLKKHLSSLNVEDQQLIRRFVSQNHLTMVTVEELQNTIIETNCQKDQQGFPISGTGVILSIEQINQIIKYLIANDIPLSQVTFSLAIRRYLNQNLLLETNLLRSSNLNL